MNNFTKLGFIMATVGAAVGLGNIWKFPYMVAEQGGGAFVLIYLFTIVFVGISVLIAEMLIGYLGRGDVGQSFEVLATKNKYLWGKSVFMAFTGLFILTFYSVVIGWIVRYIFLSFGSLPVGIENSKELFESFLSSDFIPQISFHTLAFIVVAFIVIKGIKSGIEKANYFLMPVLMLIIFGLFVYSISLDSFSTSLSFIFNPDFSKLNSDVMLSAVGHAFFTISLGMGTILTYSASLPKKTNIVKASFWVAFFDTAVALFAGVMIYAFLFSYTSEANSGPGLVFISLPVVFESFGVLGNFLSLIFFVGLFFAGISSAVSLLEPVVMYLIRVLKTSRAKAVIYSGLFFYIVGILVIFSSIDSTKEYLTWGDKNLFDWIDHITYLLLPLGGIIMSLFVGFVLPRELLINTMKNQMNKVVFNIWIFNLRFIIPIALIWMILDKVFS